MSYVQIDPTIAFLAFFTCFSIVVAVMRLLPKNLFILATFLGVSMSFVVLQFWFHAYVGFVVASIFIFRTSANTEWDFIRLDTKILIAMLPLEILLLVVDMSKRLSN